MVEYYNSKKEVIEAVNNAKNLEEVKKIMDDLEQRMAPHDWIDAAYEKWTT